MPRRFGHPAQGKQSQCSQCKLPQDTGAPLALTLVPPLPRQGETGLTDDSLLCAFPPSSIKPDMRLARASASTLVICCLNCLPNCLFLNLPSVPAAPYCHMTNFPNTKLNKSPSQGKPWNVPTLPAGTGPCPQVGSGSSPAGRC